MSEKLLPCPFDAKCEPWHPLNDYGSVCCRHVPLVPVTVWNTRHVPDLSAEDKHRVVRAALATADCKMGGADKDTLFVIVNHILADSGLAIVRVKP